mmetsp:Transcript_88684/g.264596  ORF Transcript_88684/g.264596 Transcript_88684/m.264596 type:complete len:375 (-) Transcript_88684:770-1894(-)
MLSAAHWRGNADLQRARLKPFTGPPHGRALAEELLEALDEGPHARAGGFLGEAVLFERRHARGQGIPCTRTSLSLQALRVRLCAHCGLPCLQGRLEHGEDVPDVLDVLGGGQAALRAVCNGAGCPSGLGGLQSHQRGFEAPQTVSCSSHDLLDAVAGLLRHARSARVGVAVCGHRRLELGNVLADALHEQAEVLLVLGDLGALVGVRPLQSPTRLLHLLPEAPLRGSDRSGHVLNHTTEGACAAHDILAQGVRDAVEILDHALHLFAPRTLKTDLLLHPGDGILQGRPLCPVLLQLHSHGSILHGLRLLRAVEVGLHALPELAGPQLLGHDLSQGGLLALELPPEGREDRLVLLRERLCLLKLGHLQHLHGLLQ